MRIDIISAIPKLLTSYFEQSILKRAQEKKLVEIYLHDLRDFSNNKQKSIDAILDKISKSGYESLSDKEKDFLSRYGED